MDRALEAGPSCGNEGLWLGFGGIVNQIKLLGTGTLGNLTRLSRR